MKKKLILIPIFALALTSCDSLDIFKKILGNHEDSGQKEEWKKAHGVIPLVNTANNTLTYGLYPQTHVNDSSLITILNSLTDPEDNGFFFCDQEYYTKLVAHPCSSDYKFDDGTTIVSGTTYWFKCEPIVWDILKNDNGDYFLFSDVLLDAHRYDASSNNYKNSEIRSWLNEDFYKEAFSLDDSYITTTKVDNSVASTGYSSSYPYVCEDTYDKIFLLSYKQLTTAEYGFSTSGSDDDSARQKKTTDYGRANGCSYSTSSIFNKEYYWTRSPHYDYSNLARDVGDDGNVDYSNIVDKTSGGVCPALHISL